MLDQVSRLEFCAFVSMYSFPPQKFCLTSCCILKLGRDVLGLDGQSRGAIQAVGLRLSLSAIVCRICLGNMEL